MATTEETQVAMSDGVKLYAKIWKPAGTPLAQIVWCHGFSDHCNAYYGLFPALSSRGIQVFGYDQRGWGQSTHSKATNGITGPTTLVHSDLSSIISHAASLLPSSVPLFLGGHSMGGGIALTYALAHPSNTPKLSGVVCEAPLLLPAIETRPNIVTLKLGTWAANILPSRRMALKLDASAMSRNPAVAKDWAEDKLCHDEGSMRCISDMLTRGRSLLEQSVAEKWAKTGLPVWVGHGNADKVNDFHSSQKFCEGTERATFVSYEGYYHKLHAEPDGGGETFAKDVGDWILKEAETQRPATSGSAKL